MKDAYEVLRHKEAELARIRHEITSLKMVAPMLEEETDPQSNQDRRNSEDDNSGTDSVSAATGTDGLFSLSSAERPKIWNVLKRGK